MELTPTSPLEDFFWRYGPPAIEIYYWLLMVVGIYLGVWAFIKTKNKGYVFVSLFFVLSIWIVASVRLTIENYVFEDYDGEVPEGAIHHTESFIQTPIAETLLVIGIYLISRRQVSANKTSEATAYSRASS